MSKTLLQGWYDEVWNNANKEAIDSLMDESAVIHGLETDKEKTGHEAFKPFYDEFRKSFPSVNITLEPIITTDEFEAAECFVRATTADGKEVQFTGLTIAKFKNGKLMEGWNAFDFHTMHKQLASPVPSYSNQPR